MNSNSAPMVSVYILTYNHEKYIEQAIESVLAQETSFDFEILIGDDCSTDNTQNILNNYFAKYPDKIRLFLRKKNLGLTRNEYLLKKECIGKYIAPLEGDDYWIGTERLQYLVEFLEKNPEYIGVSHCREQRDLQGMLLKYDPSTDVINKPFTVNDFLRGKRFSHTGSIYRNIYIDSGEKYDVMYKACRNVGDYVVCMVLLDIGNIYVVDRCFSVYRVRSGPSELNYCSRCNQLQKYYDHIAMIRACESYFGYKYNFAQESNKIQFDTIMYCVKRLLFKELLAVCKTLNLIEWTYFFVLFPINTIKRIAYHLNA